MTLLVIEYGADNFESLTKAATRMNRDFRLKNIFLLHEEEKNDCNYRPSSCSFSEALGLLEEGEVSSVLVSGEGREKGFMIIDGPDRNLSPPKWRGYGERSDEIRSLSLEPYKTIEGLQFVYMALEDTLDLELLDEVSIDTFPWDHWRLLSAAVRRRDGSWEERSGR